MSRSLKLLGLLITSSLPFLFSLDGDFVFDDSEAIIKNKDVFSNTWREAFYNDFWGMNVKSKLSHKSYRPLTILSFRANYFLSNNKLSAPSFKATNLICHVICCVVMWMTFQTITNTLATHRCSKSGIDMAFYAAVLFSVHPVHVEAISGIVGRADILAGITFCISFIFYERAMAGTGLKYLYLAISVILAAVSMLFKENGVTVLGFCLCFELITKYKQDRRRNRTKSNTGYNYLYSKDLIIRWFVVMIASVIILYGRWDVMGGTAPQFKIIDNPTAFSKSTFSKVATYNYIYFLNLLIFLWPQWLCYDWSMGCVPVIEDVSDYRLLLPLLLYLYGLLVILALINKRNQNSTKRLILSALCLSIIPFIPASNILYTVGFVIAERILYIPSSGYCLLVSIGLNKIICKSKKRRLCVLLYSSTILIFALRSWQRSLDWQNEYNLFISGIEVCPLNAKVRYNVAKVADAKQKTDWALQEYREAIRLYPDYYQAMNNLGNLLKSREQFKEAERLFRNAVRLKTDFPAAWMNLGIVLAQLKRYKESKDAYETALEYRSHYPDCFYNLGILYLELNQTADAEISWSKAIDLNPKHVLAWTNLLTLLDNTGQIDKALKSIQKALTQIPEAPSVNFAVANIYGKLGRNEDAEHHFKRAIKEFEVNKQIQPIHYSNLGVLYHRWRKYDLAENMYKQALKINPLFKSAQRKLDSLKKIKHQESL